MRAEQPGFTLVEILVALAIVAIALGASITALGGAGSSWMCLWRISTAVLDTKGGRPTSIW